MDMRECKKNEIEWSDGSEKFYFDLLTMISKMQQVHFNNRPTAAQTSRPEREVGDPLREITEREHEKTKGKTNVQIQEMKQNQQVGM